MWRYWWFGFLFLASCRSAPTADELYQHAVHTLTSERNPEAALDLLSDALRINSDHREARRLRAGLYRMLERSKKALEDYGELLRQDPTDAPIHLDRARLHAELGLTEPAEADFAAALRLDPYLLEAYLHRGLLYRSLGRSAEADRDFSEARRLGAGMAEAYYNEAGKALSLGRREDALRDFTFALELQPRFGPAYIGRGRVHLESGRPADAIRDFDEAIRLDPDRAELYLHRANGRLAAGQHDEARADFQAALSRDGRLIGARIGLSRVHRLRREFEIAERESCQALKLDPDHGDGLLERARVYYDWGLYGNAERDARHAVRIRSTPEGLHLLGQIFLAQGEPLRAISVLQQALTQAKQSTLRLEIESDLARARNEREIDR